MTLINQFIEDYKRNLHHYETAGCLAEELLEEALTAAGIRAIVTSRAKNPHRLLTKVISRNESRLVPYQNVSEIYADIADLSGLRVSLYFPGDRAKADRVIRGLFDVSEIRQFPEPTAYTAFHRRFPGYCATHYRAALNAPLPDRPSPMLLPNTMQTDVPPKYPLTSFTPEEMIPENHKDIRIEIQVASVLMHAWSEVEHDLVYKPTQGPLSEEELAILDELNGLVLTGEIALERLQKAGTSRKQ